MPKKLHVFGDFEYNNISPDDIKLKKDNIIFPKELICFGNIYLAPASSTAAPQIIYSKKNVVLDFSEMHGYIKQVTALDTVVIKNYKHRFFPDFVNNFSGKKLILKDCPNLEYVSNSVHQDYIVEVDNCPNLINEEDRSVILNKIIINQDDKPVVFSGHVKAEEVFAVHENEKTKLPKIIESKEVCIDSKHDISEVKKIIARKSIELNNVVCSDDLPEIVFENKESDYFKGNYELTITNSNIDKLPANIAPLCSLNIIGTDIDYLPMIFDKKQGGVFFGVNADKITNLYMHLYRKSNDIHGLTLFKDNSETYILWSGYERRLDRTLFGRLFTEAEFLAEINSDGLEYDDQYRAFMKYQFSEASKNLRLKLKRNNL